MTRKFWMLLSVLSFSAVAAAQADQPTFKSKAQLVLVPAIVTEHGNPVKGLTSKDFVLSQDGRAQELAVFEEIDAVPANVESVELPPHTVQNFAPSDSKQDVVILLLDFLNGKWSTSARIRSYLSDMTKTLTETRTPVTVLLLTRKGLVQVHSFASAPENLSKAVEQWAANVPLNDRPNMPEMPQFTSAFAANNPSQILSTLETTDLSPQLLNDYNLDKASMGCDAAEQIAQSFRGIPGRKKLVWISTGFLLASTRKTRNPSARNMGGSSVMDPVPSDVFAEFKINDRRTRAWKALSDSNIAVYPVDSNDGQSAYLKEVAAEHSRDSQPQFTDPSEVDINTSTASMLEVAQKTGGQNCTDRLTTCIKRVQADGNHYYLLGFYLHGEEKPGWHKLNIKMNQPGMSARTRQGFMVGLQESTQGKNAKVSSDKTAADKEIILTALASPLDYTSIPLQMSWSELPPEGKGTRIELLLLSPPGGVALDPGSSSLNLDYLAFIRPVGKTEGQTYPATLTMKLSPEQQKGLNDSGFRYRHKVNLAPGRYEVRVLLRDNLSQKIGTVSTLIDLSATAPTK